MLFVQPTFGAAEKARILDLFRERRKQRKKESRKATGGSSTGSDSIKGSFADREDGDVATTICKADGDLQSLGNGTSSTASSFSSHTGAAVDGTRHGGKMIHVLTSKLEDNMVTKTKSKKDKKSLVIDEPDLTALELQSNPPSLEKFNNLIDDRIDKMMNNPNSETETNTPGLLENVSKLEQVPVNDTQPLASTTPNILVPDATLTPSVRRKTVVPPPGFLSCSPRSSALKPMSPGKIGLRPTISCDGPIGPKNVYVINEQLSQPMQQQEISENVLLPTQPLHSTIHNVPPMSEFPPLSSLTREPISRSSSLRQPPPFPPRESECIKRSMSLNERSGTLNVQDDFSPRSCESKCFSAEKTLPTSPMSSSATCPFLGQYIHLSPSLEEQRAARETDTAVPANPIELAKKFLDLYYPRLSSVNPAASLLPFYTPNSQKSISINGAHSVVTGHVDIAQQFLRSRNTIGAGNMQILSVVAQELHSNSTSSRGGVLIVVTGMAHTQIPSAGADAPSSSDDGSSTLPSLMRYSCPFSHTVTLVPAASVPISNLCTEPLQDPCLPCLKALSFTSKEDPKMKVVGYQIHNDALTLLSGDAYRA